MRIVYSFLFSCILFIAKGQGLMYYPFSSQISISSSPARAFWVDTKWQTNSFFANLSTEIAPHYNITNDPRARVYVGGGVRMNFISLLTTSGSNLTEGYFGTLGVRSALFPSYPKLQLGFEFSPYVNRQATLGLFRTNLGVGYYFGK
jgi:hypothetical protein